MSGPADIILTKQAKLRTILAGCIGPQETLLVAYSGGVDSAYLAWAAHQVLGERMLAVIADSASLPRKELAAAMAFAETHAIPLHVIATQELASEDYVRNDAGRCFHCKDELFRAMEHFAQERGQSTIAYGRNLDDRGDFRPGQRAADQHAVLAPLAAAELGKREIRMLARDAGLALWDKPAAACLASRVEYGRAVTAPVLAQVEAAEEHLRSLGFLQVRVRHHGEIARIEIDRAELERALSVSMLDAMTLGVKAAGFAYVALDTSGYRSGSMNDLIPADVLFSKR